MELLDGLIFAIGCGENAGGSGSSSVESIGIGWTCSTRRVCVITIAKSVELTGQHRQLQANGSTARHLNAIPVAMK